MITTGKGTVVKLFHSLHRVVVKLINRTDKITIKMYPDEWKVLIGIINNNLLYPHLSESPRSKTYLFAYFKPIILHNLLI